MPTLNKQVCEHCGQSINEREIGLFKGMVTSLYEVWKWCELLGKHEFTRKDIKHLLTSDNQIARFGDWAMFGGLVYKEGKGHYGLNLERCRQFFMGELAIPTIIYKNPLTGELRKDRRRTIKDIPALASFLTENNEYIARYVEPEEPAHAVHVGLEF